MTEPLDSLPEPSDGELDALSGLLARADVWADADASIEDDIVAAITDEARAARALADTSDAVTDAASPPPPTSLDERRAQRRWSPGRMLGAAAVAALVVAGVAVLTTTGSDDGGTTFALAGTEAAPGASAEVEVTATPAGLKIIFDAEGLEGAPEGSVYEAWVGDGEVAVSAGTFHLRGGDGPIELWAGVADPSFRRLWVTVEPIDDDLSPSGDTRLRGEFDLSVDD